MSDNVIGFPTSDHSTKVLEGASEASLKEIMVIGWTTDDELYLAGSTASIAELLLLLEMAKRALLDE